MTVEALCEMGHDVMDIRGTPQKGLPDNLIWEIAQKEMRLLITTDKGFAKHRSEQHHGVLIVRLQQPNRINTHRTIMQILFQYSKQTWVNLTVVAQDQVQSAWYSDEH
ncbi:MAG: DUF5615 family PIN-like protein [Nitrospirae bacterium]|nr:DUF5615 family PIN-like protein [Nitrospirota bacterium]MBF0592668.1 DUF5615 family PIN-like protein [Nitrospirota bacterium]